MVIILKSLYSNSGSLNDLWGFDVSVTQWKIYNGIPVVNGNGSAGNQLYPDAREQTSYLQTIQDERGSRMIMFGGFNRNGPNVVLYADVWELVVDNENIPRFISKTQRPGPNQQNLPSIAGVGPGSRSGAVLVGPGDFDNNFHLFGGRCFGADVTLGVGLCSDVWRLVDSKWESVETQPSINYLGDYADSGPSAIPLPRARELAAGWLETPKRTSDTIPPSKFFIFGGDATLIDSTSKTQLLNDVWELFDVDEGNFVAIIVGSVVGGVTVSIVVLVIGVKLWKKKKEKHLRQEIEEAGVKSVQNSTRSPSG